MDPWPRGPDTPTVWVTVQRVEPSPMDHATAGDDVQQLHASESQMFRSSVLQVLMDVHPNLQRAQEVNSVLELVAS